MVYSTGETLAGKHCWANAYYIFCSISSIMQTMRCFRAQREDYYFFFVQTTQHDLQEIIINTTNLYIGRFYI